MNNRCLILASGYDTMSFFFFFKAIPSLSYPRFICHSLTIFATDFTYGHLSTSKTIHKYPIQAVRIQLFSVFLSSIWLIQQDLFQGTLEIKKNKTYSLISTNLLSSGETRHICNYDISDVITVCYGNINKSCISFQLRGGLGWWREKGTEVGACEIFSEVYQMRIKDMNVNLKKKSARQLISFAIWFLSSFFWDYVSLEFQKSWKLKVKEAYIFTTNCRDMELLVT